MWDILAGGGWSGSNFDPNGSAIGQNRSSRHEPRPLSVGAPRLIDSDKTPKGANTSKCTPFDARKAKFDARRATFDARRVTFDIGIFPSIRRDQ
jgi:hypothetical protein